LKILRGLYFRKQDDFKGVYEGEANPPKNTCLKFFLLSKSHIFSSS
jgi:hypothetical protein